MDGSKLSPCQSHERIRAAAVQKSCKDVMLFTPVHKAYTTSERFIAIDERNPGATPYCEILAQKEKTMCTDLIQLGTAYTISLAIYGLIYTLNDVEFIASKALHFPVSIPVNLLRRQD